MAKKKVGKKKSSSSSHATKKHITHTKRAIEKIDSVPVVQQEIAVPTQNETLNVKPAIENVSTEPAPIFRDEAPNISIKPEIESKASLMIKIFAIALCCFVMILWIGLAILSTEINSGPKPIVKNVSITTYNYEQISFSKFMNITDVKYSEEIIQKGYLRQELTDKGLIKKYLVDDKGNKIELMLRGVSQSNQYDKLFLTGITTKEPYNVTGTYRFEINRYIIEVDNITTEYKLLREITTWRMENMTTDDVKGVTFNIARGVNKIISFKYQNDTE